MLPLMPDVKDLEDDEKIFGESYDSEEDHSDLDDSMQPINENDVLENGSEDNRES